MDKPDKSKNTGICYIAGAGDCTRLLLQPGKEDMVIAVDGGYDYLKNQRIDLVIGDFDSLPYLPVHPNVIRLQPEKNDTDMLAAIKEGMKQGYRIFHIYGGMGGRFSHTHANIQCLSFLAKNGASGYLHSEKETLTIIQNAKLSFTEQASGYVSVFAYSGIAAGVTERGLKYRLDQAVLTDSFPIGISNEFMGKPSEIIVEKGQLLIITAYGEHTKQRLHQLTDEQSP